ncbi:MAG: 3,4-dehydroadipyl-CoA semialdehyde dehydrogenase [Planctomycetota bacterium]
MKTLRSFVAGDWHTAGAGFVPLHDPCSEAVIAQASSAGIDFRAALEFARTHGGAALRELTFAQRSELLLAMSKALHSHRDELIELSLVNTGATRKDAKFDLDGATGTLSYYAYLGKELGSQRMLARDAGVALGRTAKFWGQHVATPLSGVAVHINAFNFPAWGFAEKAACALLSGMPVITKPATSSAMVTERCIEILVAAQVLPAGALSLVCGSVGDLLSQLGAQDVLAFTGSAATAVKLRGAANLLAASVRVNIEADSLNAAVLGPDVNEGAETYELFVREVVREMTQKSGQKCTAVRRILVPRAQLAAVEAAICERLHSSVTGNPQDPSVNLGPLATREQLSDAVSGVKKLATSARRVFGTGERVDGIGNPPNKGYFFAPTLLRADNADSAHIVHQHEVFGPVATLLPYDGGAAEAARCVALGGGMLVTSVYSDDVEFVGRFLDVAGSSSGRVYLGSEKMAEQALGSGLAMPQSLHGGPGRAGGGAELGGVFGLELYMQRVSLQGSRPMIERLIGDASAQSKS